MQLPFAAFTPQRTWTAPRPEEWPAFGRAKGRVCIDLENNDEKLKELGPGCFRDGFYIAGIGVAIDGGPKQYIPLAHKGGGNVDNPEAALLWARDNAAEFTGDLVNCHVAYDLKWMKSRGIHFPKTRRFYDPIIMDTLVYELHRRADMDAIAQRLKIPGKDKSTLLESAKLYGLKNPLAEMHKLPANLVYEYNLADVTMPLVAFPLLWKKLEAMDCLPLLDIETRLTPILVDMFMRGLRVNIDKLDAMEAWYLKEEKACCDRLKDLTGVQINIGDCDNANRIGPVLERLTGVRLPRGPKKKNGKEDVLLDEALLAALEDKHEGFKLAHYARKMITARAFCPQTREHLVKGRIHATYNQTRSTEEKLKDEDFVKDPKEKGAKTGRMSCQNTNLTQQPSRDPWAKGYHVPDVPGGWRGIYEPEEGKQWYSADYAQQEPRITTAKAATMNLPKARETALAFLNDELLDNHAFMAELTGLPRKKAKNIYLGLVYSMGDAKLCRSLKLPTRWCVSVGDYRHQKKHYFAEEWEALSFRTDCTDERVSIFEAAGDEGQAIIGTFHARAPFLQELSDRAKRNGRKFGVIKTILNRHLHLLMKDDGKYDRVHACLNQYVQGSAADQMKKAMVDSVEAMPDLFLQGQVHDQDFGSVPLGKEGREMAKEKGRIMRNTIQDPWMTYRVDVAVGPNWGEEYDMCYNQYCIVPSIDPDKKKWCAEHAPKPA